MLRALDLFSGIGGISVALGDYARTIGYVEIDKYAQSVLLSRMADGDIETAPIFRDITKLDGTKLCGSVDLICGGFPCQDLSVAGRGKGLAGERSGLFFEIIRLVKEISPRFVFLENVPAIRIRGLSEVVNAFTEIGYDCRWTCLSAASVGAPHKRERWFLLGYSKHNGQFAAEKPRSDGKNNKEESSREIGSSQLERASEYRDVQRNFPDSEISDSMCDGLERHGQKSFRNGKKLNHACDDSWWSVKPAVGRVANELSHRVDRIKCLGNSVVPLQVKTAFERLIGYASI